MFHNSATRTVKAFVLDPVKRLAISRNFSLATMISTGSDLTESKLTLQNARPWHMDDKGSNLAQDNIVTMNDLFEGKKIAFFGIPAPFTGACTVAHYPPYKQLQEEFKSKGVDKIVLYCVADPYALYNWGETLGNDFDKIAFLADPDGSWAESNGLGKDYPSISLGRRSERFSMVVENGIVKSFNIVTEPIKDAENLLEQV
mmetsp:Transcript_10668/g.25679  ORF Transcript_10668/g.25679 Transcript_10668/m.25679 type:complete len:201 (+) Transcript_10668:143-745(+)